MIFLTGFPGFLGSRLVKALSDMHPDAAFGLLIQPKFEQQARDTLDELELTDRAVLLPGDITQPDLDLGDRAEALASEITHAYHLAAVYDLAVPRDIGWRVNVEGTRHVLDFLEQAPDLGFFGYISTAYVSGQRTGLIREDELVHAAGFKNHYEETKYHAEVLVQDRMDRIPTAIFRPAIVVGDSQTGETAKFDGPYFVLKALRKLPPVTLMTRIGSGNRTVNLVPSDFVIDAMTYLSAPEYADTVYHLTDPNPPTTQEIMETFTHLMDMKVAYVPIPPAVARTLMDTGIGKYLGIAPELIDYFDHAARYDGTNTQQALDDSGIACPSFFSYAPKMLDYLESEIERVRSEAMY